MKNISKHPKKQYLLHFDPVARAWVFSNEIEDSTLRQFFLINLYLFDSNFFGIVMIDKLHNSFEGICLLKNCYYGNGEKTLFQLSQQQF